MTNYNKPIEQGYNFTGSKYISEAWNLFKKEAGSFIGATVLYIIVLIIVNFIPLVNILSTFVQASLFAGYLVYARGVRNGTQSMGDFFGGFNYFGQITLYYLVLFLMYVPVIGIFMWLAIPWEYVMNLFTNSGDPAAAQQFGMAMMENIGMFFTGGLILVIYGLYLTLSYSMVLPLIVDAKMVFWQAMETSRKTVGKNFFSFFGFYLIYGILAVIGIFITLFLGILVFYPMVFLVMFVMYEHIYEVGRSETADAIASFGQDTGEINSEAQEKQ